MLLFADDALNADWLTLARTGPRGPIEDAEVTNAKRRQAFSDYLLRNILGRTTHIVNNPTNAPAAIIASIDASENYFLNNIVTYGCYRRFANVFILCYVFGSVAAASLVFQTVPVPW